MGWLVGPQWCTCSVRQGCVRWEGCIATGPWQQASAPLHKGRLSMDLGSSFSRHGSRRRSQEASVQGPMASGWASRPSTISRLLQVVSSPRGISVATGLTTGRPPIWLLDLFQGLVGTAGLLGDGVPMVLALVTGVMVPELL